MKPSWNEAPVWANYLAQDRSGDWYWYSFEPRVCRNQWLMNVCSWSMKCGKSAVNRWKETLERKPK